MPNGVMKILTSRNPLSPNCPPCWQYRAYLTFLFISRTNEYLTHGFSGTAPPPAIFTFNRGVELLRFSTVDFYSPGGGCCVWKACVEAVVVKRYMI